MEYKRSNKYDTKLVREKIMGPNPIKLDEELLMDHRIPQGAMVMDLGSGKGLTSVFLVKEYGLRVFATDLWSNPTDNKRFFDRMGLTNLIGQTEGINILSIHEMESNQKV